MTMLAALARYYDRMAERDEVPPFGYSIEKIGWCLLIDRTGTVCEVIDLRQGKGSKRQPQLMAVPQPTKRTFGVASNFLWDKTPYVLGITAGEGKRTARENEDFKSRHRAALVGTDDEGLAAFSAFLDKWTPDQFEAPRFPDEMRDGNVVFRVTDDERRYLHERPAAKAAWARQSVSAEANEGLCLVAGERSPIERLHPAIKGVWGAQSSGASIVSFNLDAFTSYGNTQGANAPVGKAAAFAYTTVLNRFLAAGSPNRVQIGDASTVFWAEAGDAEKAAVAEDVFAAAMGLPIDERLQAGKVRPILDGIARGRPLAEFDPALAEGVRFYVLGLSPNASRLSVRFWFEDSFGRIADNVGAHARDMRLDPPPREERPSLWRLLVETASQRKSENIPPQLAGETLRAILSDGRYPATLLATLLMRLRADGEVKALRIALLKAIIARSLRLQNPSIWEDKLVSLDPENTDPGYLLGRLFAVYEHAQTAALGTVNATVKDKFYGSASATPRHVFPLLDRGSVPHLAKVRKEKRGYAISIEKQIAEIMERIRPQSGAFPASLPPEQQALFALGYYHQRNRNFTRKTEAAETEGDTV